MVSLSLSAYSLDLLMQELWPGTIWRSSWTLVSGHAHGSTMCFSDSVVHWICLITA